MMIIIIMMIIISQSTLIDLRRFGYHFTIYPPLGVVHLTLPYPGGVIVSITNNKTIYIYISSFGGDWWWSWSISFHDIHYPPPGVVVIIVIVIVIVCYYYLLLVLFVIVKLNTMIITNNNIRVDVSRRGLIKFNNNNNKTYITITNKII